MRNGNAKLTIKDDTKLLARDVGSSLEYSAWQTFLTYAPYIN